MYCWRAVLITWNSRSFVWSDLRFSSFTTLYSLLRQLQLGDAGFVLRVCRSCRISTINTHDAVAAPQFQPRETPACNYHAQVARWSSKLNANGCQKVPTTILFTQNTCTTLRGLFRVYMVVSKIERPQYRFLIPKSLGAPKCLP